MDYNNIKHKNPAVKSKVIKNNNNACFEKKQTQYPKDGHWIKEQYNTHWHIWAAEGMYVNVLRRCQYTSPSPSNNNKIEMREDAEQLSDKKWYLFHSIVAKLLFIMKRYRPYLDTEIGFLTTRSSKIDLDDWEILRRVLRCFSCTLGEKWLLEK